MFQNSRTFFAVLLVLGVSTLGCTLAQPVIDRVKSSQVLASLRSDSEEEEETRQSRQQQIRLVPTFTPTPDYTDTPTVTPTPTRTPIPTETPTPLPTDTPAPTDTPVPTDTPAPTNTSPPRPTPEPTNTFTPAPTPTPNYPYKVVEQGNREFQHTNYHRITIYAAVIDPSNIPVGGIRMVGEHTPSGRRAESKPSDWSWSVANCLGCNYIKQGNLKFEPGAQEDGTWNIYLVDGGGTQISDKIPLSYSSSPEQWVWDFFIFQQK